MVRVIFLEVLARVARDWRDALLCLIDVQTLCRHHVREIAQWAPQNLRSIRRIGAEHAVHLFPNLRRST